MKIKLLILFCLVTFLSCNQNAGKAVLNDLNVLVDSVRARYVPDSRDDVFDIAVFRQDKKFVVKGVTSVIEAKTDLINRLGTVRPDIMDGIKVLPDESLGDNLFGITNVSVADLRTTPGYDAEMATQLLLGFSMQLLQTQQGWYRVKTPEGYVAWIQQGTIIRMNNEAFQQWEDAPKVIFTDNYGFSYETPETNHHHVSDIVFGNLLKWESDNGRFYRVSYPDGRQAYLLKSQSSMFNDWKTSINLTEESIVEKALELRGIPYSWGGTSVKTMDCSGFAKTVYLKHGIVLRRDASQQAKTGSPVDISNGYDLLRPGDLLFFGKNRVRHVAIYIDNKEFIHAAGYVRTNSLDPAQPNYDEGNTKEFIYARRILGAVGTEGIWKWDE